MQRFLVIRARVVKMEGELTWSGVVVCFCCSSIHGSGNAGNDDFEGSLVMVACAGNLAFAVECVVIGPRGHFGWLWRWFLVGASRCHVEAEMKKSE